VKERLPEALPAAGIWARPTGERFYAAAVRNEARTELAPEQIHALGLEEVARIVAEMDGILAAQGLRDGSVGERIRALASEPRFLYPDTAEGRAALLERIEATAADMQKRLPAYFGVLPAQGFTVRPVPAERQAGASLGFYDGPPADGSAPGTFWINLRSMDELAWFGMPTLTYHETVPGHHLQIALARSSAERPALWRFTYNAAYSEGWALYAEQLAAEMGVYADDPFGNLGRLRDELHRAVRLVVDTGLHHKRWTRGQAETYMAETIGLGEKEIRAEVLRYMAWPGQALSYKLGMLAILDMREDARRELGEAFDIAAFHDTVLATGPVSMPLLRQQVEDWAQR
jgi:uncharacterized protein (DUF885 family)